MPKKRSADVRIEGKPKWAHRRPPVCKSDDYKHFELLPWNKDSKNTFCFNLWIQQNIINDNIDR